MSWLKNLKIGTKVMVGFIIVALLAGVVGAIGIVNMGNINESATAVYEKNAAPLEYIADTSIAFQQLRANLLYLVIDHTNSEKYLNNIKAIDERINKNLEEYEKGLTTDQEMKGLETLKTAIVQYNSFRGDWLRYTLADQDQEALAMTRGDMAVASKTLDETVTKLFKDNVAEAEVRTEDNKATAQESTVMMLIVIAAAVALAIGLGIVIARTISKPIAKLVEVADKMALGDVDVKIEATSEDEIGDLIHSFSRMIENIQQGANAAERIAAGDLNVNLKVKSENDLLGKNLNLVINNIKNLMVDVDLLVSAAVEGKLSTRADVSKHEGEYKKVVEGINSTLDAVIQPLNQATRYIRGMADGEAIQITEMNYQGDFKILMDSITSIRNSLNNLVAETVGLSKAAVEGNLSARGDISKFKGGYIDIIDGFNKTLNAVVEPMQEALEVLQEMARGNLHVSVRGNYKGDHASIKEALNESIHTLSSYTAEISEIFTEMANGNLNVSTTQDYKGDFADMKNAIELIIESFNEMMRDINTASEQVASGARQVSDSSQALSQGSTEQASSIEELTATITQIATQTKQNAINANQASELAVDAKENAAQGNKQMEEMLKAMEQINESSANISKIIKVIDEIAFQTNILALNAAVEAARAGQHGKGFAVVAEEVRNLAARSANAAKETTVLIEGSIHKVEAGTKIAETTATALNKIVEGVGKTANLVGEIAVASNEQATGIAQINQGINQVSEVTQTNSATAEESAAASEELSSQAAILQDMVSRFKLQKGKCGKNRLDGLSPEVLQMIEDMTEKKKVSTVSLLKDTRGEVAASRVRISLSDKDFGKY